MNTLNRPATAALPYCGTTEHHIDGQIDLGGASDEALVGELERRAARWECEHHLGRGQRGWSHPSAESGRTSHWARALGALAPRLSNTQVELLERCGLADEMRQPEMTMRLLAGNSYHLADEEPGAPSVQLRNILGHYGTSDVSPRGQTRRHQTNQSLRDILGWTPPRDVTKRTLDIMPQRRAGITGRALGRVTEPPMLGLSAGGGLISRAATHGQALANSPLLPQMSSDTQARARVSALHAALHTLPATNNWILQGQAYALIKALLGESELPESELPESELPVKRQTMEAFAALLEMNKPHLALAALYLVGDAPDEGSHLLRATLVEGLSGQYWAKREALLQLAAGLGIWSADARDQLKEAVRAIQDTMSKEPGMKAFYGPDGWARKYTKLLGRQPLRQPSEDEARDVIARLIATELLMG